MNNRNEMPLARPFGEPIDLDVLLEFAEIDAEDMESAIEWWDDNASPDWVGALNNPPVNRR